MPEHGLIFSAESMRAFLHDPPLKSATRRTGPAHWLVASEFRMTRKDWEDIDWTDSYLHTFPSGKQAVRAADSGGPTELWPRAQPGDVIWCRETWGGDDLCGFAYKADHPDWEHFQGDGEQPDSPWRNPMFMPKIACRLRLRVETVAVQRVQDITEEEAIAEGVQQFSFYPADAEGPLAVGYRYGGDDGSTPFATALLAYAAEWDRLNGKGAWARNDWIVVYGGLERIES